MEPVIIWSEEYSLQLIAKCIMFFLPVISIFIFLKVRQLRKIYKCLEEIKKDNL